MSTTDPRSRFGQYRHQAGPATGDEVPGLLALSISKSSHTYHYHYRQKSPHQAQPNQQIQEEFCFDSDSENEEHDIDEMYGQYAKNSSLSPSYAEEYDMREYEALSEEIGRRHAAPSKRKISAAKQSRSAASTSQPRPPSSGVFVETDIDSGQAQIRSQTSQSEMVRTAKSVGDLAQSPRKNVQNGAIDRVSPSDRDKSKSVNFGKDEQFAENSLSKPRSKHDLRVDKSLERINVPDWYRDGGDEEEDSRMFRLKSVHDEDDYFGRDGRVARSGAFHRTKSAPPARKPGNSSTTNPIDAFRQSRHWALSRAVGNESRASTTASAASHFRRPSVRYAEKDASMRRPKPIAIRPLDAVLSDNSQNRSRSPPKEKQTIVKETEVKTSNFSFHKQQPIQLETTYVPEPTTSVAISVGRTSPLYVPVEMTASPERRVVSPPGPPTHPKPNRNSPSPQPNPPTQKKSLSVSSPPRQTSPLPPHPASSLLVMEEKVSATKPTVISNSNAAPVDADGFEMVDCDTDEVDNAELMMSSSGRRPVLLAGYNEAETYVEQHSDMPKINGTGSIDYSSPRPFLSPSPQPLSQPPPSKISEPTPFVYNNRPVVQPFHGNYQPRSSRVTDIDDVPINITPVTTSHVEIISSPLSDPFKPSSSSVSEVSPPIKSQQNLGSFNGSVGVSPPIKSQQNLGSSGGSVGVSPPIKSQPNLGSSGGSVGVSPPIKSQQNLGSSGGSVGVSPPIRREISIEHSAPVSSNDSLNRSSWKSTTVMSRQNGDEEVIINRAVEVKTQRASTSESIAKSLKEENVEEALMPPPPRPSQQSNDSGNIKRTNGSSLRASFKKPGKIFSKLWKPDPEPKKITTIGETAVPPTDGLSYAIRDTRGSASEKKTQPRPISTAETENNAPAGIAPTKETEKPTVEAKNHPFRSGLKSLFWKPDRNTKASVMSTSVSHEVTEKSEPSRYLSKSSHEIAVPAQKLPQPDESFNIDHQTTIDQSMTISEMSTSLISEPSTKEVTKKPKASTGFSPVRWISSRSPAKQKVDPKHNGEAVTSVTEKPHDYVNSLAIEATNSRDAQSKQKHRDDVERMMGDQPSGFTPIPIPDKEIEKPPVKEMEPQFPSKSAPPPPRSALSSSSRPPTAEFRNYDSVSRVSSRFGSEREKDLDAISTTSSQKSKKSRNIFRQIMDYQEEHDHGRARHYVPAQSGESASWLNRRDVSQMVNSTMATNSKSSNPNTPAPGSPVSNKSLPGSRIASDAFSLSSQIHNQKNKPEPGNLSTSYHAGMSTSSHSLAKERERRESRQSEQRDRRDVPREAPRETTRQPVRQPQPPAGPYTRQMQEGASNYENLMAHQQRIRQQRTAPRSSSAAPAPTHYTQPPPPMKPVEDLSPPVTCQRPGCNHTVSAERARHEFRVCSSCGSAFCSRQCRDSHLVGSVGKRRCPLDQVRDLCQKAAKRLESDRLLVALLSQFARMSYLCHGRGYVYAHFSGPDRAAAFSSGQVGLHSMALEFHTISHTEAALVRGEPLDEVMDLLQAYNPDSKLVLCVGVAVASDHMNSANQNRPPPMSRMIRGGGIGSSSSHLTSWDTAALEDLGNANGESRVVLRAAKLRLSVPRPGTLRALLLVSAGVAFQNRRGNAQKMREITFGNIQNHLKKRGVDLLSSHPNVYTRLTQYVSGAQEFPPTGLCVWDNAVGRSMLALLFPDALPRQDWLRSLHQLGEVELGLPDPRQVGMGVDV